MSAPAKHRVITTGRRYQAKGTRAERREKRTADNIVFDSQLEMQCYVNTLKPLLTGRVIRALQYHPVFVFQVNDVRVGSFEADFSYIETATNVLRVIDVKAWERHPKTGELRFVTGPDYLWQKQLMLACFSIQVEEA